MKHDTETLREMLHDVHRTCRVEMGNVPMSQVWPVIGKLIEACSYASAERRGDAIERAIEDITKMLGECRRTIIACNARIEAEERAEAEREAAAEEARQARAARVALVG